VLEEACLATHADGRLKIERERVSARSLGAVCLCLDERVEARAVRRLGVAVEQQRRVVRIREAARVQFLEVRREVVDALCVEELVSAL